MRKLKFRGKSNGEWYYGDLIQARAKDNNIHCYIITDEYTTTDNTIELKTCASPEVLRNTVGQYTGLKDKNGTEIYETDIIEIDEEGRQLFGAPPELYEKYQVVIEHDGCHMVTPLSHYKELYKTEHDFVKLAYLWIVRKYASVVGNITDNLDIQMQNIETLDKQSEEKREELDELEKLYSSERGIDMTEDINILRQMLEEKDKELEEYVLNKEHDCLGEEAEAIRRELFEIQDKIMEIEQERLNNNKNIVIGDYIRMDNGDIDRVTDIPYPNCYKCKDKVRSGEYIAEHSKDLINLLNQSDILQIKFIKDDAIAHYGVENEELFKMLIKDLEAGIEENKLKILGVLSKQQFNQNCFMM